MMNRRQKIINALESHMRLKELSQAEISSRIGVSKPTMSNFLRGKSELRADYFDALLLELGVDVLEDLQAALIKTIKPTPVEKNDTYLKSVKILINSLDKTSTGLVFNTLLKLTSRNKSHDVVKARESIKNFLKR